MAIFSPSDVFKIVIFPLFHSKKCNLPKKLFKEECYLTKSNISGKTVKNPQIIEVAFYMVFA
jgi:hypothetical protein